MILKYYFKNNQARFVISFWLVNPLLWNTWQQSWQWITLLHFHSLNNLILFPFFALPCGNVHQHKAQVLFFRWQMVLFSKLWCRWAFNKVSIDIHLNMGLVTFQVSILRKITKLHLFGFRVPQFGFLICWFSTVTSSDILGQFCLH